jgi:hypothetical protein
MGEIVEVDPTQLRSVADCVLAAADQIARISRPAPHPDALRGSRVGGIGAPVLVAARLGEVVADMQGWVTAVRLSADAFERAEHRTGERFEQ